MKYLISLALGGAAVIAPMRVHAADAHSNCINRCLQQQVNCSRTAGMTGVSKCNNESAACQRTCPPPSPTPPASTRAGAGGGQGGGQGQAAPTPVFPGGKAPLPAPVDTSAAGDAEEAEEDRIRLEANASAVAVNRDAVANRAATIALNRFLESVNEKMGDPTKIPDPPPIPPPIIVPAKARRGRGSAGSVPGASSPLSSTPWPKELETPPTCSPVAGPFGQSKLVATCGPVSIHLSLEQEPAVNPGHEEEKIYATIQSKAPGQINVSFRVRTVAQEGDVHEDQQPTYQVFTHAATANKWLVTPFPPSLTCPRHVQSWQITDMYIVDYDAAYADWLTKNPQCDPKLNGGTSACYFAPGPAYRQACSAGSLRVR